jgi:hypothetical protein
MAPPFYTVLVKSTLPLIHKQRRNKHMADPVNTLWIIEEVKGFIALTAAGMIAVAGWFGKRQVSRIDALEASRLNVATKGDIVRLHDKIDEQATAITTRLDKLLSGK